MGFLHDGINGITSLFFPSRCPYCSREGVRGCKECLDRWRERISVRYIEKVPILSMHPYDQSATSILLAAKGRGERDARFFLSTALQFGLEEIATRVPSIRELTMVAIPASKRAIRRRGEDFLLETLKLVHLNQEKQISVAQILRWRREVRDQSSLTLQERAINLRASLAVDEGSVRRLGLARPGGGIVLIDDVLTTGATMEAAISAISHSSLGTSSLIAGVTACYSVNPRFM